MALRAVAEVDLDAIEHNVGVLRSAAGGAAVCAVVKADGYGHGAAVVAGTALAAGATMLAVATAAEAMALRDAGLGAPILVMGALSDEELALARRANAEVGVWEAGFLDRLSAVGPPAGGPWRVHVKLDTGMGRLGTRDGDVATRLVERVDAADGLELAGLWTHFATADDDLDFCREQLRRFLAWAEPLRRPGLTLHAANSGATVALGAAAGLDLVRCGIGIYGGDPANVDPDRWGLRPALTLRSYVAAVKPIAPGESAGYGRRFVAREPGWFATVPIGYADGISRALTNRGAVLIGGRRFPIAGTVSMDNLGVDLGPDHGAGAPGVAVGDPVTLIGTDGEQRILAEEVAGRLATINYEVLCAISARVPRRYVRGGRPA